MHMTDSLGRSWQLGTVQLDYNLPERFELAYIGADNAEHRPAMIHRALFGSFERFIGILLEHLGGELPVWLAPVQAIVLPITDRQNDAAAAVARRAGAAGLRGELDDRAESVGRKIRDAELRKIPYMLVVGRARGAGAGTVAVRERGAGDTGAVAGRGVRRAARSADRDEIAIVPARCPRRAARVRPSSNPSPEHLRPAILAHLGHRTTRNAAPSPRLTRAPLR